MIERGIGLWVLVLALGCSPVRRIKAGAPAQASQPPAMARAHYLRGQVLYARGELEAAQAALSTARMFDPDEPRILSAMAHVSLTDSDVDTARAYLLAATHIDPDYAEAWYRLGRLEQAFGEPAAAASAMQRTLDLDGRWEARASLIGFSLRAQDGATALTQLKAWTGIETEDLVELEKRAQMRAVMGDASGAAMDWMSLFELGGGNAQSAESLVQAAIEGREAAAVLMRLDDWLVSAPPVSHGWVSYGLLSAIIGDWGGAIDALERMEAAGKLSVAGTATLEMVRTAVQRSGVRLSVDQEHHDLRQVHAQIDAGELEQAALEARDLLRAQPGHPGSWDALGQILFLQGRRDAALRVLGRAQRLAPDDPAIRDHRNAVLMAPGGMED